VSEDRGWRRTTTGRPRTGRRRLSAGCRSAPAELRADQLIRRRYTWPLPRRTLPSAGAEVASRHRSEVAPVTTRSRLIGPRHLHPARHPRARVEPAAAHAPLLPLDQHALPPPACRSPPPPELRACFRLGLDLPSVAGPPPCRRAAGVRDWRLRCASAGAAFPCQSPDR